jgi:hypothetical protein
MFAVTVKFDLNKCPGGALLPPKQVTVSISIDTKKPDAAGTTIFRGEGSEILRSWLAIQSGLYGKFLSDRPTPVSLNGVLARTSWITHRVVLGSNVLKLPLLPTPAGALP